MSKLWTTPEGDAVERTDDMTAEMRPLKDAAPELLTKIEAAQARRGRPRSEAPKKMQSFKLSQDVIAAVKASGRGFNARVEAILRREFVKEAR